MPQPSPLERFHRAWFAPELEYLGYRCAPLCFGHIITLSAIGSPFASFRADRFTAKDVMTFLHVCANASWPFRSMEAMDDPPEELVAQLTASDEALVAAGDVIEAWMSECLALPELWESEATTSGRITAPDFLFFTAKLIRNGFSQQDAFTMPLGMVHWWVCTLSEMDGAELRFVTDADVNAMEEMEAAHGHG